ncbi:MAG TPA: hypothetical protein VGB37_14670 [Candidatus Lokiarchaeia archaeon]
MDEPIKIEIDGFVFYSLKRCDKWLKYKFRKSVEFTCQNCKKHESEVGTLEIHRIKRGCEGGLYTILPLNNIHSNVKIYCKKCHLGVHSKEFK